MRWLLRTVVRLAIGAGLLAGVVALTRAVLGRTAGEPGVPGHRTTPMSFDAWPAVPPSPARTAG